MILYLPTVKVMNTGMKLNNDVEQMLSREITKLKTLVRIEIISVSSCVDHPLYSNGERGI